MPSSSPSPEQNEKLITRFDFPSPWTVSTEQVERARMKQRRRIRRRARRSLRRGGSS
jgi:hypothetical protein